MLTPFPDYPSGPAICRRTDLFRRPDHLSIRCVHRGRSARDRHEPNVHHRRRHPVPGAGWTGRIRRRERADDAEAASEAQIGVHMPLGETATRLGCGPVRPGDVHRRREHRAFRGIGIDQRLGLAGIQHGSAKNRRKVIAAVQIMDDRCTTRRDGYVSRRPGDGEAPVFPRSRPGSVH